MSRHQCSAIPFLFTDGTAQRADARFAHIPLVVRSADWQLDSRREVLVVRSYLCKPVAIGLLITAAAV